MLLCQLVWLLPVAVAFRLINPDWEHLIQHVLVEADASFDASSKYHDFVLNEDMGFLDKCYEGLLTAPFPQFLCPLLQLHSMSQPTVEGPLNSSYVEIYNQAVNLDNHPCNHSAGLSCVVLFLPLNRILFGCSKLDGQVLQTPSQFTETFVVTHRISEQQPCEKDSYGETTCSLESVFYRNLIVQEQHACCCPSGYCAVLYFDQGSYLLPFIRMIIDVEEAVKEAEEDGKQRRKRKREAQFPPLSSGRPDLFLGGGVFFFFVAVILVLWFFSADIDARTKQEAVAYGIQSELIDELFPESLDASSASAVQKQPAVGKQPVNVDSDTVV